MSAVHHPKDLLDAELVQKIRSQSASIEQSKEMTPAVLDLIYEQRWFQLFVPKSVGGLELPLPEVVKIFEALTWADGNLGWIVNLGAGANMFAGYFEQSVSHEIFSSPITCCAGSGFKGAKAIRTKGGYTVSGHWRYASGSNHATHFTGNGVLYDEQEQVIKEGDEEVFKAFIFPKDQVKNFHNWNSIGLVATSSNDIEVDKVFVPDNHVFSLIKPSPHAQGPTFQFPFAEMAYINMAVMITGLALHFEDLYLELAATKKPYHGTQPKLKENDKAQSLFNAVSTEFHAARNGLYKSLDAVWEPYTRNDVASAEQLTQLKDVTKKAASASRKLINELFPLFGMNILDPANEANRVWRDAATAGQHYLLSPL